MSQGRIVWMDARYSGDGEVADVGPGRFNGPKYIEILVEVLLPSVETRLYPENAPFYLVQDNSLVHKCRVVQQVGRTDGHSSLEDLLEAPQCSKKRTAEDLVDREEALQIDSTSTSPVTEPTTTPSPQFSTPSLSLKHSPLPSLESCLTPRAKKQKTTPNKSNVANDMTVETFKVSAKDDGCSTEQGARLGNRNCSTFC
ncbi:hypothetical protein Pcinc_025115 [Petrolisthes cinctipes]|uniref:Uncharacterized protein n=1 Tax=Petrolisthes cinctipes TaxID=88211 RepID=A0AAE1F944_PETCI|nr:hypothetical protein Pcinc_025115 [Petrolisthes cinctipes]